LTRAKQLNAYCRAYRRRLDTYIAAYLLDDTNDTYLPPIPNFEDTILMKQIERDEEYSYEV
jgi:hypothetical protein